VPTLNSFWPDLSPGRPLLAASAGDNLLWQREWRKHGVCYARGSTTAYFLDAVGAAASVNLTQVLAAAGIVPSATRPYSGEHP
jgi:ribonuclease I